MILTGIGFPFLCRARGPWNVNMLFFLVHGSLWLAIKSEGELHRRAVSSGKKLWPALLVAVVIFLIASMFATPLYDNSLANPILFAVILITVLALLGIRILLARKAYFKAWFSSALTIVGATFYGSSDCIPTCSLPVWILLTA